MTELFELAICFLTEVMAVLEMVFQVAIVTEMIKTNNQLQFNQLLDRIEVLYDK